jgi:hypothetical protein
MYSTMTPGGPSGSSPSPELSPQHPQVSAEQLQEQHTSLPSDSTIFFRDVILNWSPVFFISCPRMRSRVMFRNCPMDTDESAGSLAWRVESFHACFRSSTWANRWSASPMHESYHTSEATRPSLNGGTSAQ